MTVEGLLATPSVNVWNTPGGLNRLCSAVDSIFKHKLKVTLDHYGSRHEYWGLVRSLRWLNPYQASYIDQINKLDIDDNSKSLEWLKQSLFHLNLSGQLWTLVENESHLKQYYSDDAFLCDAEYFCAFYTCLQAVEQNTPALLAEINPKLLRQPRKISHSRCLSDPLFICTDVNDTMPRRASPYDHLAPPRVSPITSLRTENLSTTSDEHATAVSFGSSPDEPKAKDALLQVLHNTGEKNPRNDIKLGLLIRMQSDPLMNIYLMDNDIFNPLIHRTLPEIKPSKPRHYSDETPDKKHDEIDHNTRHSDENNQSPTLSKQNDSNNSSPNKALQKQTSQASIMLDNILNNEDDQETFTSVAMETDNTDQNGNVKLANDESDNISRTNPISSSLKKTHGHVRSHSDMEWLKPDLYKQQNDDIDGLTDFTFVDASVLSSSLPGPPRMSTSSLLEDGGGSLYQATECYFPRPEQGQSLRSFLESQDFNTCAELDRENAHFSISEALIAAIEQMKWNQVLRPLQDVHDGSDGESDEEIQELKQRIRIRRREKLQQEAESFAAFSDSDPGACATPTDSSDILSSNHDASNYTEGSSSSSAEIDDEITLQDENDTDIDSSHSNLTKMKDSGLSASLASFYSEAELQKQISSVFSNSDKEQLSAESVAIALLKRFSEKCLPKASELEWLVSEQDAPQALLPLPDSWPVSPDESQITEANAGKRTRIRGNSEWAPPRAQIIFSIHPPAKRKAIVARQNYRCTGCGTKIELDFIKRLRYCEYLGKYFCQCCHTNAISYIPGRILRKWDFTKYYVSNFARDLVEKMYNDPLFNISAINDGLYKKVKTLSQVKECRGQLHHLRKFFMTCRLGEKMLSTLSNQPNHWIEDVDIYSLRDLVQIKNGELYPHLKVLVTESVNHVTLCPLCQGKGFVCEVCNNEDDILFPFQLNRVSQCPVCRACYHQKCFIPDKCPKCVRIEMRRQRLLTKSPSESADN